MSDPLDLTVLGIDVGGSGIKGAPIDIGTGQLVQPRFRLKTPSGARPQDVAETVKDLVDHFSWTGPIGLTIPGRVKNGIARTAANIDDGWIGTNAEQLFSSVTQCPAVVINDADAAGLAEMVFGAGRGCNDTVLVLTVGTGIGSSLFVQGRLVPNTELGHLRMGGTVAEGLASNRARKQNKLTWEAWAIRFQAYLEYLEFLLDPDLIIIGGGVSRPKRTVRYIHMLNTKASIVPAQLQNEAGMIGAACAARRLLS